MAKPRNDLLDRLQYLGLRLVSMTMHAWPVSANIAVARRLGDFMSRFDKRHRDRALDNLRASFPGKPESELHELARESMRQLFMLGVEVMFTTRLVKIDTIAQHLDLRDFRDTLRLLLQRDHGLIMLTGHYGNWEILGYALATLGFETTSVARPLDNPYVNDWLLGVRARQGQRIIPKKGATEGGASVMDANAMQYNAPVVIGYARRVPGKAFKFIVGTQDIIRPDDWRDQPDPLRYITQRYAKAIEDSVRADPGQYLWVHRRWKTAPKSLSPR